MTKLNSLFLCTGNSCRSQMAEGLTNHFLGHLYRARSAGVEPSGYVHPLAIRVMQEIGIDISRGVSKRPDVYHDITFDLVITVCDDAAETCPLWLREGEVVHIGFYDPALAEDIAAARKKVGNARAAISQLMDDSDIARGKTWKRLQKFTKR